MTLIVEDGTIVAGAESYNTIAEIATYHANRGNTAWAALASDAIREQCARKATDYMVQLFRSRWKGNRVSSTQSLDFPRDKVYLDQVTTGGSTDGRVLLASNVVPSEVKKAHCELSLLAASQTLLPNTETKVSKEIIGPLTFVYDPSSPQTVQFNAVKAMLAPYLNSRVGRVIH